MSDLPIHYAEVQRIYAGSVARGLRILAVTSAEPGEGVTTVALALARRAGASGERALLVETNLFRPSMAERIGMTKRVRWTVAPQSSLDAIIAFPEQNLGILPAPIGLSADELLQFADARAWAELFATWREQYDVIICDCSSINRKNRGNIDVSALCEAGAAPIMVVLSGKTQSPQLAQAVADLTEGNISIAGTVLNKRYDPPLYQEMLRDVDWLAQYAPRIADFLRGFIEKRKKFLS